MDNISAVCKVKTTKNTVWTKELKEQMRVKHLTKSPTQKGSYAFPGAWLQSFQYYEIFISFDIYDIYISNTFGCVE